MTFQAAIARELPFLRRYARTLSGSQKLGDAGVRDTLHAMIDQPEAFGDDVPVRVELYRTFHTIWQEPEAIPGSRAVVGTLPHIWRKALILTTIEGFSPSQAAYILGISEAEIDSASAQARASVESMLSATVLIIEDEAIIAMHLKQLLTSMRHKVVGTVKTHREAVAAAMDLRPELILADINLADGSSGIDAVKEILDEMSVPVIFITAFPERLLTGERPEPAYLVTKPFEPETVAATVWQALLVHRESHAMSGEPA